MAHGARARAARPGALHSQSRPPRGATARLLPWFPGKPEIVEIGVNDVAETTKSHAQKRLTKGLEESVKYVS